MIPEETETLPRSRAIGMLAALTASIAMWGFLISAACTALN